MHMVESHCLTLFLALTKKIFGRYITTLRASSFLPNSYIYQHQHLEIYKIFVFKILFSLRCLSMNGCSGQSGLNR